MLLPTRFLHGFPPITRSNPPNEFINGSNRSLFSYCTSTESIKFSFWFVCSHQILTIFLFTSEISTDTTLIKGITSRCRETSTPTIPKKRERRLMPLGNMSFKTERWYSTVSIGNELPSNLYLSVQLIPPPLMWFLGNPKSISTLSSSNGATLFLPIQTRFRF